MDKMEKLGEKLQKNVWKKNKARLEKEGRKTMSIMEMGKLLGLKKTDSYWLANKHRFDLIQIRGHTRVDIDSFERWYDNQVKYCKVDGPPPGAVLKQNSYSPQEISKMIGICEQGVYELIKSKKLPFIMVDFRKRVPVEEFEYWYAHQDHYRVKADRERDAKDEALTMTMPEMAGILGVSRSVVYSILKNPKYRDEFVTVVIAGKKRITKESFDKWYRAYGKNYRKEDKNKAAGSPEKKPADSRYYTMDEICRIYGCSKATLRNWISRKYFPVMKIGGTFYISRQEFDSWYGQISENQEG